MRIAIVNDLALAVATLRRVVESVAVVAVQHIGPDFAPGFVSWLAGRTGLPVRLAAAGGVPTGGHVYVAGSDEHFVLGANLRFAYTPEPGN